MDFLFFKIVVDFLQFLNQSTGLMKTYYKSTVTGVIVEALSETKGRIVRSNNSDYVEGREYDFNPFAASKQYGWMWKECSIQDIPCVVNLKDVLELLHKQKFADWYGDGGNFDSYIRGKLNCPLRDQIFTELKEMLDAK